MDSVIIFCAKYLLVAVVAIFVWLWLAAGIKIKKEMAATVILAGILALIASRIAGKLYYDPRPFVTHHVKALIPHAADNGFPSDHALLTMALTAVLYFYNKKWAAIALAITAVVGIARVAAHIHSPIDIAGAWAISITVAAASYYAVRSTKWFKPEPAKGANDN